MFDLLSIDLSGNVLKEFPYIQFVNPNINHATQLKKLDLSRNKICNLTIEENVFDMTYKNFRQLKLLDLSSNNLTEFPVVLRDCPKLEILRLIFNKITEVPALFFTSESIRKNLQELNMNSNPLKEISPAFQQLESLKILGISYTEMEEIPKCVA
jgi:Leucine-rich repeat (LRR) protein